MDFIDLLSKNRDSKHAQNINRILNEYYHTEKISEDLYESLVCIQNWNILDLPLEIVSYIISYAIPRNGRKIIEFCLICKAFYNIIMDPSFQLIISMDYELFHMKKLGRMIYKGGIYKDDRKHHLSTNTLVLRPTWVNDISIYDLSRISYDHLYLGLSHAFVVFNVDDIPIPQTLMIEARKDHMTTILKDHTNPKTIRKNKRRKVVHFFYDDRDNIIEALTFLRKKLKSLYYS